MKHCKAYTLFLLLTMICSMLVVVNPLTAEDRSEKPDSNTTYDEKHQGRGFFVQVGPLGGLQIGEGRSLDLGPGMRSSLGYVWGLFGLRSNFMFLSMDVDGSDTFDFNLYNANLDVLLFPLHQSTTALQPYLVFGPGYYYLHADEIADNFHGFGGDLGFGVNYHLSEHLALTLENVFQPVLFCQNGCDDNADTYFYSFTGQISYFF